MEKKKISLSKVCIYLFLAIASVLTFYPLFWMVLSSLQRSSEIFQSPLKMFVKDPQFGNYAKALEFAPFLTFIKNSAVTAIIIVVIQLILSSLIAYSLSQFRFKGRKMIFNSVLATYMLPSAATYVPAYVILAKLNLIDSLAGVVISNIGSAFMIFLIKQTFDSIPKELIDYARTEGASDLQILAKVMIPISKSTMLTAALIGFVQMYNNYLWPSLILNSESNYLVTVGINQFFKTQGGFLENLPLLMAGNTMSVLPLLILFVLFQKVFIKGISDSGLKG